MADRLLQEDGSLLLLEDGSGAILLESAGAGALPPAPTLLRAIVDRVLATPALADALPGGFDVGKVADPQLQTPPYGELHEVSETYWYGTTAPAGLLGDDTRLQADFYGDPAVLKAIKDAFEAAFGPYMGPLRVAGRGFVSCVVTQARLETDAGRAPDAGPLARQVIEFRVLQSR